MAGHYTSERQDGQRAVDTGQQARQPRTAIVEQVPLILRETTMQAIRSILVIMEPQHPEGLALKRAKLIAGVTPAKPGEVAAHLLKPGVRTLAF